VPALILDDALPVLFRWLKRCNGHAYRAY
jgi:hypothetical protein